MMGLAICRKCKARCVMSRARTFRTGVMAAALGLAAHTQVCAQEAHIFNDTIHVGMGAAKAWPDKDARNASSANGLQLFLGWRLSDYWGMQFSSSYFNYETGNSAVSDHYRSAAGLDLLWLMRKEGWQPFLLTGAGAAYNDVYPNAD